MQFKFLFFFLVVFSTFFGCTEFFLKTGGGPVIGRSMEFGLNLNSEIITFAKGEKRVSYVNNKPSFSWLQKYSFIGVNAFKMDIIVDGMNEKGLSVAGLWFIGAEYPEVSFEKASSAIALQDVGNWILGSFANTEEVKKALSKVTIYPEKMALLGKVPPMHFSIHDKEGKSLVIEFIEGKMQVMDNPIGVLTNAPSFAWQLTNLRNYINLTPESHGRKKMGNLTLFPTGQGTGLLGLPGDWTPPSRFVKIAICLASVQTPKNTEQGVNLSFHLLNTVDIPKGLIQSRKGKPSDYTQWVVVKDLENQVLYFRTYDDLNIRSVTLGEMLPKSEKKDCSSKRPFLGKDQTHDLGSIFENFLSSATGKMCLF